MRRVTNRLLQPARAGKHCPMKSLLTLVAFLAAPALAQTAPDAQAKRGQALVLQCRICHTLAAGEPHRAGPNLHGIVGARAASRAGFTYSAAMKASGLVWDAATLDSYLTAPAKALPGTRMAFGGIAAPADRAAIIAYLANSVK